MASDLLGVYREATTDFTVDARALTKSGGNHIKTCINNPSGNRTDALIRDLSDGTYQVEYTPYEEGKVSRIAFGLHFVGMRSISFSNKAPCLCRCS